MPADDDDAKAAHEQQMREHATKRASINERLEHRATENQRRFDAFRTELERVLGQVVDGEELSEADRDGALVLVELVQVHLAGEAASLQNVGAGVTVEMSPEDLEAQAAVAGAAVATLRAAAAAARLRPHLR